MEMLPNDKASNGLEKVFRWLPIIAAGVACFWFWGTISSFVVRTLEDTIKTVIYGVALTAVALYVWNNPSFIWQSYVNVCRKITSFFIKMDPLSYMDRYADYLSEKLRNLKAAIVSTNASKIELERQIAADTDTYNKNMKLAQAAIEAGSKARAQGFASEAKGAQDSIKLYTPTMARLNRSLAFMEPMAENWEVSIQSLRSTISRKRRDFAILKKNAAALKQSEAFLKGETEEGRIYQESVKALEEQVCQKIAYIDDFEKRAKPILEGAAIEKAVNEKDAMDLLDEYMNSGKLELPDFSNMEAIPLSSNTTLYKPAGGQTSSKKFNLLK